jgi:hypothetical protein
MGTRHTLALTQADLRPAVGALLCVRQVRILRVTFEIGLQTQQGYGADKAVPTHPIGIAVESPSLPAEAGEACWRGHAQASYRHLQHHLP